MAEEMTIAEKVGRHDERLSDLEIYRTEHREDHKILTDMVKRIEGRPSWAVAIVLSSMASTIVYLIMKLVG